MLNYSFHVNYAKVKIQVPNLEASFNAYFFVSINISFGIMQFCDNEIRGEDELAAAGLLEYFITSAGGG